MPESQHVDALVGFGNFVDDPVVPMKPLRISVSGYYGQRGPIQGFPDSCFSASSIKLSPTRAAASVSYRAM